MGQHEQSGAFAFNHAKRTELSDGSFHDYQTQVIIFPNGVIWAVNNGKPSFFVRQMFAPRVPQIKPTTLVPTVMVDCEVGLWSTFSVCNRNCNTGTKQRFRSVVQTPMNNGAYCPQLSDGYACAEEPCKCRNINLPKLDGALLLQGLPHQQHICISLQVIQTLLLPASNRFLIVCGGTAVTAHRHSVAKCSRNPATATNHQLHCSRQCCHMNFALCEQCHRTSSCKGCPGIHHP